jgi:hypothetical protein
MQGFTVGPARRMAEVMCGMGGSTFILDPLVARSLREEEGFENKRQLAEFLAREAKTISPENRRPFDARQINFIVLGGEWNPVFMTADFTYVQTEPIDRWIPASGIRKDEIPVRMPVQLNCMDGTCEIPQ